MRGGKQVQEEKGSLEINCEIPQIIASCAQKKAKLLFEVIEEPHKLANTLARLTSQMVHQPAYTF